MVANFYRPLNNHERRLAQWMLENGNAEASQFLQQLNKAEVTPRRCTCGCASINFKIKGMTVAPPGVHKLGDFLFYDGAEIAGIFIYESGGILSGLEVFGMATDAPKALPQPEALMTYEAYGHSQLKR